MPPQIFLEGMTRCAVVGKFEQLRTHIAAVHDRPLQSTPQVFKLSYSMLSRMFTDAFQCEVLCSRSDHDARYFRAIYDGITQGFSHLSKPPKLCITLRWLTDHLNAEALARFIPTTNLIKKLGYDECCFLAEEDYKALARVIQTPSLDEFCLDYCSFGSIEDTSTKDNLTEAFRKTQAKTVIFAGGTYDETEEIEDIVECLFKALTSGSMVENLTFCPDGNDDEVRSVMASLIRHLPEMKNLRKLLTTWHPEFVEKLPEALSSCLNIHEIAINTFQQDLDCQRTKEKVQQIATRNRLYDDAKTFCESSHPANRSWIDVWAKIANAAREPPNAGTLAVFLLVRDAAVPIVQSGRTSRDIKRGRP